MNTTIFQAFHWCFPANCALWESLAADAATLHELGISMCGCHLLTSLPRGSMIRGMASTTCMTWVSSIRKARYLPSSVPGRNIYPVLAHCIGMASRYWPTLSSITALALMKSKRSVWSKSTKQIANIGFRRNSKKKSRYVSPFLDVPGNTQTSSGTQSASAESASMMRYACFCMNTRKVIGKKPSPRPRAISPIWSATMWSFATRPSAKNSHVGENGTWQPPASMVSASTH